MRSDPELLIFMLDLKKDGLAYAVPFCKIEQDNI